MQIYYMVKVLNNATLLLRHTVHNCNNPNAISLLFRGFQQPQQESVNAVAKAPLVQSLGIVV